MRSATASPQGSSTTTWLPITIEALLLILVSPSHTSAAPITTLSPLSQPPFMSHLEPAAGISTSISTSPVPIFQARDTRSSNDSLPFPLQATTTPFPLNFPGKDQQEANYISSNQYPAENGPEAEKSAAAQPKMIAMYVVIGVAMLVLGVCVVKALMYRSRHGGFWW